jgi:hypothetical protein
MTKQQKRNREKIKDIFLQIKHEKPWSSTSRFYVALHLTLFTLIWGFALYVLSDRHEMDKMYLDTPPSVLDDTTKVG